MSQFQDKPSGDLQRSIEQLWDRVNKMQSALDAISKLVDQNMSVDRILKIIKSVHGHTSEMPDLAGQNSDHDIRYSSHAQVAALIAKHVTDYHTP